MKTLSDHPLFIGAMLERADARQARRIARAALLQRVLDVATRRLFLPLTVLLGVLVVAGLAAELLLALLHLVLAS